MHGRRAGRRGGQADQEGLGLEPGKYFFIPEGRPTLRRPWDAASGERRVGRQPTFEAWAAGHPDLASEWRTAWPATSPTAGTAPSPRCSPPARKSPPASLRQQGHGRGRGARSFCWAGLPTFRCLDHDQPAHLGDFDGRPAGPQHPLRGARTRDGRRANGMAAHGGLRTFSASSSSSPTTCARRAAGGAERPAGGLRVHPRFDRPGRGRPHPPAGRAPASLRCMPDLYVIRPADATETAEAWKAAMHRKDGPTALVLSRQNVPPIDRTATPRRAG